MRGQDRDCRSLDSVDWLAPIALFDSSEMVSEARLEYHRPDPFASMSLKVCVCLLCIDDSLSTSYMCWLVFVGEGVKWLIDVGFARYMGDARVWSSVCPWFSSICSIRCFPLSLFSGALVGRVLSGVCP